MKLFKRPAKNFESAAQHPEVQPISSRFWDAHGPPDPPFVYGLVDVVSSKEETEYMKNYVSNCRWLTHKKRPRNGRAMSVSDDQAEASQLSRYSDGMLGGISPAWRQRIESPHRLF